MTVTVHVVLKGWKPGLRKVALDGVLQERTELSLSGAHAAVNRLLAGETVTVGVASAAALIDQVLMLGVDAATVEQPVRS